MRRIEAVTGERAEQIIYAAEDTMRDISDYLHNPQVLQAVKKMFESNEALSKEVETMRREQVAQWADKIIASTPERRGVQLIATQTDRTPEFVKDLAYCLRARAPKLVLVQGSVNDGKPMLTVMLGEEITAQGVNAGAVVREAAKLMQGGGGGQPFRTTAAIREHRMDGLYKVDKNLPIRQSHKNPDIQTLYSEFLQEPNSHLAHELLHTHYHDRRNEF